MLVWRNHPLTRKFFFDPTPVATEVHAKWFATTQTDPNRYLLIAEDSQDRPVGVVRFDRDGDCADINIYLNPECRGGGLGGRVLEAAMDWLKRNSAVKNVRAEVISGNNASLKMFKTAGFQVDVYRLSREIGSQ